MSFWCFFWLIDTIIFTTVFEFFDQLFSNIASNVSSTNVFWWHFLIWRYWSKRLSAESLWKRAVNMNLKPSDKRSSIMEASHKRVLQKQPPKGFLRKSVLKICSKFAGKHPSRNVISIKLLCSLLKRTSAWVFSCKFVAYFQNTFS